MKNKRKILSLVLALVMVLSLVPMDAFAASKSKAKVKLKETAITMTVKDKTELKGISKQKGVSVKKLTYSSMSKRIAKVNKKGIITARNTGKTTIKTKVKYVYNGKEYTKILKTKLTVTPYVEPECEHVYGEPVVKVPATCEKDGKSESTCTKCGEKKTDIIPKLEHKWDEGKVTVEATCANPKETTTFTCLNCSKTRREYTDKTVDHVWNEGTVIFQPTCKQEGIKEYKCLVCNSTKTESIPKLEEHVWDDGEVTTNVSCIEDGETTYTCKICKETKTEPIVSEGKHTWDEGKVINEPTCTLDGSKLYTCTVCKQTKLEAIPSYGEHKLSDWKTVITATCNQVGRKVRTCTRCGYTDDTAEYRQDIPKTQHKYVNHTNNGTCVTLGYTYDLCSICGDVTNKKNLSDFAPHQLKTDKTEPTCTKNGSIISKCTISGCTYVAKNEPIDALGHLFTNERIIEEANCVKPGYKQHTCTRMTEEGKICGYTERIQYTDFTKHKDYAQKYIIRNANRFFTGLVTSRCEACRYKQPDNNTIKYEIVNKTSLQGNFIFNTDKTGNKKYNKSTPNVNKLSVESEWPEDEIYVLYSDERSPQEVAYNSKSNKKVHINPNDINDVLENGDNIYMYLERHDIRSIPEYNYNEMGAIDNYLDRYFYTVRVKYLDTNNKSKNALVAFSIDGNRLLYKAFSENDLNTIKTFNPNNMNVVSQSDVNKLQYFGNSEYVIGSYNAQLSYRVLANIIANNALPTLDGFKTAVSIYPRSSGDYEVLFMALNGASNIEY